MVDNMATEALDLPHLSSYLTFPESSLNALLDAPNVALVRELLDKVATKAREHQQIQSEKLKLDVELENVVRATEIKSRILKESVEKGLKEITDLRQRLNEKG